MKRIIPFFSLAVITLAACNNNTKTTTDTALAPVKQEAPAFDPDTVGLAQFQQWKAQNELSSQQEYKEALNNEGDNYTAAAPVKKVKTVYRKPVHRPAATVASLPSSTATTNSSSASTTATTADNGTMSSESANTAKAPVKEGWSKAAKGSVIGGVGGAVAGAVINKNNRAVGAVIGGIIGAGGGYAIGRGMDKKDGRY